MNKCKLILFDLDGVTINTEPLYEKGETKLFSEYGITIPKEDWKLFRGCTEKNFYDLAMKRYKINENKTIFMKKGREYILKEFEQNLDFMHGFKSLITRLKNKYELGLVTASPEHMYNWLNARLHLDQIFKHVVHSGMTKKSKPNPEPYILGMKKFMIPANETMIIEDSVHGIRAGINAKCKVVALMGSIEVQDMPPAHEIIQTLDEINMDFINSLFQNP